VNRSSAQLREAFGDDVTILSLDIHTDDSLDAHRGRPRCTGLRARSETVAPPPVPELLDDDRERLGAEVFAALAARLPWVAEIEAATDEVRVEGGWVYSQGRGLLDDPTATVHSRGLLGVTNVGSYFSVDTGKYSVAPTLAEQIALAITAARQDGPR